MAFQVSPGVNVSEIDLTTVVPAVSTTEAAIAGPFRWGPVAEPILVSSEDELANRFGKPTNINAETFMTAANFLAYGNKLFVVRAVRETDGSGSTVFAKNAHYSASNSTAIVINNDEDYLSDNANGEVGYEWVARFPGDLGNSLGVSVCDSATAYESTFTGAHLPKDSNAITMAAYNFTGNTASANALADFTLATSVGDLVYAGSKFLGKAAAVTANTIGLDTTYTGETIGLANTSSRADVTTKWEFWNNVSGAPGTSAQGTTKGVVGDQMHVVVYDSNGEWSGTTGTPLEVFDKVNKLSDAKLADGTNNYYRQAVYNKSKYIHWLGHPGDDTGNWGSTFNSVVAASNSAIGTNLTSYRDLTGGHDGGKEDPADNTEDLVVTAADVMGTEAGKGYSAFRDVENIDVSLILAGPNRGDDTQKATVANYIIDNIADYRKDCVAYISAPKSEVVQDLIDFRNALTASSYAVLDNGYKYQYDKYNDLYRYVPLNGDIAGLCVRTDLERDAWFSPAGFNRGSIKNIIKLFHNPNQADRDLMYQNDINPVTTFAGQGTVLFGDKTLLGQPSAFDRINVRRLFIVLEKAISTASKFSLFEFNDEFTRAQFRNLVEPFLRDVQGRRGIFDFRVVCDETNNTGEVIDRNEFVGDIYVKPARSINFIQLNFVAVKTGVEFSEVVGQF